MNLYSTTSQSKGTGLIPGPANLAPGTLPSACAAPNADGTGMPQQSPHPKSLSPGFSVCACPRWASSSSDGGGGRGPSHIRMDPNKKCWMTGSLPNTSARYILIIPSFTLSHVFTYMTGLDKSNCLKFERTVLTAEMSSSIGECHLNEAVLICHRQSSSEPNIKR